jgi:hypothetical protein
MLLACGALFTACVPITSYEGLTVSAPRSIPSGWRGEIDRNGRTILRLDEIDVRVDARNAAGREKILYLSPLPPFVWDYQSNRLGDPDEPLVIFLELHPRKAGFSFDPMAVRLSRDHYKEAVTPRVVGPGRSSGERCHDPERRRLQHIPAPETFDLPPGDTATCFVLAYDVFSFPSGKFRLLLDGLFSRGDPVELPELNFEARPTDEPITWTPPGAF